MITIAMPIACLLAVCMAWGCSQCKPGKSPEVAGHSIHTMEGRTLADFESRLTKSFTNKDAESAFGKPDRMPGSGLLIYAYDLADGREILLAFGNEGKISYAKVRADGQFVRNLELK